MAEEIVHATDSNFDETINQGALVLVDFWADWCHPCKMVTPIVEDIAKEYKGKMVVAKLNVDENSATASRFNVMSIPTLAFFKGGKVVDKLIGAVPKGQIEEKIQVLL